MSQSAYQFKIELVYSNPLIWRRIAVPDTYTFWDLHVAIQDVMGWQDCHLHEFRIKDHSPTRIGIPNDEFEDDLDILPDWEVPVKEYFKDKGDMVEYVYDFGDGWNHHILFEAIQPLIQGKQYPVCLGGERNGPPEDCGGVPGYEYLIEVLGDPDHAEHDEMKAWIGGDFDPEYFDCRDVEFENPKTRLKRIVR